MYLDKKSTEIFFLAGDHIKGFISVNEKYDKSKFVDIVVPYKNNRSDEFEFISIK